MRIRLGYVAMTLNLQDCSPSGTVTVAAFEKIANAEGKMHRLRKITAQNLQNTYRILLYNQASDIHVYRFTSKLVPLATHPLVEHWDYTADFREEFLKIGDFVKEHDMRVSAHPDHFTLINTNSPAVLEASLRDLDYHVKLLEAMGLDACKYKLVIHTGGLYKDREQSIARFKENFVQLPERIRCRIILENDDKSFSARDVLGICQELKIPMVLDVHHHACVNHGEALEDMLKDIFNTWEGQGYNPKVHFSSPKSEKDFRSHADVIDFSAFETFLRIAAPIGRNFDIMLEAKDKDNALLRLSEQLSAVPWAQKADTSTFDILL